MLSYHAYFEALAALQDSSQPDWHETTAGLAILRIVDEWLDESATSGSFDEISRRSIEHLIERIPAERPLRPILTHVWGELTRHTEAADSLKHVAGPLLLYTDQLHSDGMYNLVEDALTPILQHSIRAHQTAIATQISLKLAISNRVSGRFEVAEEYYATAKRNAQAINDLRSLWHADSGLAKICIARGDPHRAEILQGDIERRARARGDMEMLQMALHDRSIISSLYYDNAGMLELTRQALACCPPPNIDDGEGLLIDYGLALLETGQIERSRQIHLRAAVLAHDYSLRRHAMLGLLRSSVLERDKRMFDLYSSALGFAALSPMAEVQFRAEFARGLRIFGEEARAGCELQKAADVAKRFQISAELLE